ncbi:MAG: hypothetical protein U0136_21350 [Bdellovibrionota bacterium]
MFRLLFALMLMALVYVLWDRGYFGDFGASNHSGTRVTHAGEGPGATVGDAVDRGMAKVGRAVERAGQGIQNAATGHSKPGESPTPTR